MGHSSLQATERYVKLLPQPAGPDGAADRLKRTYGVLQAPSLAVLMEGCLERVPEVRCADCAHVSAPTANRHLDDPGDQRFQSNVACAEAVSGIALIADLREGKDALTIG